MMSIIVDDNLAIAAWFLEPELKAPLGSHKRLYCLPNILGFNIHKTACRTGCNSVFYIHIDRHTKLNIGYCLPWSYKVEDYFTIAFANVRGMEITFGSRVGVNLNTVLHPWFQRKPCVNNQCATRTNKLGEVRKTLEIVLIIAIDVKMIGVGRSYHRYKRR